jgi:F-type H+-transporting ATPase subunit b
MRRVCVLFSLLACVLLFSAVARAEAPTGQDSPKTPSIFEPALDLTIWTIVVFLILVFVLGRYAWKPMLAGLQQREKNIQTAQEEAKRAREEAQRLRDEVQKKLDGAGAEVQTILEHGRRDAQKLSDDLMAKTRTEIQAERDRLRREIETAKDSALHELWQHSAQLATLISAKAIRRQLSPDDHRRLVDEAVAELAQAGRREAHA